MIWISLSVSISLANAITPPPLADIVGKGVRVGVGVVVGNGVSVGKSVDVGTGVGVSVGSRIGAEVIDDCTSSD